VAGLKPIELGDRFGREGPTYQLEERGYLNPGDRGNRVDECEAIANFLTDSLAKSG
jgi:hypothetical protein